MTSIRLSAGERLAVEEHASIPTCVAPRVVPDVVSAVAPTDAPKVAPYVLAEHRMTCSAILEMPKGSSLLQLPVDDPPPYAKRVSSFRVYAGTPSNRGTGDLCRIWNDEEDSPLDPPSAEYHAWAYLDCLCAQPNFAGRLVPASDLKRLYPRFCHAMNLPERSWQTVAFHLNRLTGGDRPYRRINGPNIRVYRIPERRKRSSS